LGTPKTKSERDRAESESDKAPTRSDKPLPRATQQQPLPPPINANEISASGQRDLGALRGIKKPDEGKPESFFGLWSYISLTGTIAL
jgi:hypothetical protein